MKKLLTIFLLSLFCIGVQAQQVNLIFIQGESNASGEAYNPDVSVPAELTARAQAQIWNNNTNAFQTMQIGTNNDINEGNGASRHGMELALANAAVAGQLSPTVYIVKAGYPGSTIDQWRNGGSTTSPINDPTKLSWSVVTSRMDAAIAALTAASIPYKITVWQTIGINDFNQGTTSTVFQTKMTQFETDFRTRYGSNIAFIRPLFFASHPYNTVFTNMAAADAQGVDKAITTDDLIGTVERTSNGAEADAQNGPHWTYNGFKLFVPRMVAATPPAAVNFTIGSGSGSVSLVSMTGHNPGDTCNITGGTYTSGTFTNIKGIYIRTLNHALVTFTGGVNVDTWQGVTWRGNFTFSGFTGDCFINSTGTAGHGMYNSTIDSVKAVNVVGNILNASGGIPYTFGDTTTYHLYKFTMSNIIMDHCGGMLIRGAFGDLSSSHPHPPDVCDSSDIFNITSFGTTVTSGEGIVVQGSFFRCDWHDWKITSTTQRPASGDVGAVYLKGGNGKFYNIYINGGPGYAVRIYGDCEQGKERTVDIWNCAHLNGTQYGVTDYRFDTTFSIAGQIHGCGGQMYNCTGGNLQDQIGYWSGVGVIGVTSPYFFKMKSNFGFNLNTNGKSKICIDNGGWVVNPGDTSNNFYYNTASSGALDSTSAWTSNSLGSFAKYSPTVSSVGIVGKGVLNPFSFTDIFGVSRPNPPSIGYAEIIPTAVSIFTSQIPATGTSNDGFGGQEVGLRFRANVAGNVTGVRFYKTANNTGTHTGELYDNLGNRLAQVVFSSETATGWQTATFSSPISILANTTYVVAYFSSLGNYVEDNGYFATSGLTNGPLTALQDGVDGCNGPYDYTNAAKFPSSCFQSANYWVDVVFISTGISANAGPDQTITLPTNSVTLNGAASTGSISTYAWTQVSGPNTATLGTPNTSITTASGLIQGTYTFQLSLNAGVSTDQVVITVAPVSSFNFTTIPTSALDLQRPSAGANQWIDGNNVVKIPDSVTGAQRLDAFTRMTVLAITGYNSSANQYDWTYFDSQINDAISKGQTFSFALMQNFGTNGAVGGSWASVNGANLRYPLYLHNQMQAEAVKDFITGASSPGVGGNWIPNYNSPSWLLYWKNLCAAINTHIMTGSFNGRMYRDVIFHMQLGGYGDFGEWTNNHFDGPAGSVATVATLDSIISYQVLGMPNFQWTIEIGAFDCLRLPNTQTPVAVGWFAYQIKNNKGLCGMTRLNWGWDDAANNYIPGWTITNGNTFVVPNGFPGAGTTFHFDTAAQNRYKYAPWTGEPADLGITSNTCGSPFCDIVHEMTEYHCNSFGNGNFDNTVGNATMMSNIRAASKAAGYRLILTGGSAPVSGTNMTINLNWQNVGTAPSYTNWHVIYELRNGATVVWRDSSAFKPYLFLPTAQPVTKTDAYNLTGVTAGTYSLYVIVQDSIRYRTPMPLFINGRNGDGSYLLTNNVVVGTVQANAGSNQTISLPTSSVTLDGTGSTGTITSYAWTRVSGPNTPTIVSPSGSTTSVTGLVQGTYVFQLSVNGGASTSNVSIFVNAAPVANAGVDQTITLPTNSVTLNGSGSTGTINSYAWTQISGPNTSTITTPSATTTTVTGLIQGTYVFQLSINGGVSTDQVSIIVQPAPVANAGPDQTITLPTSSVNLTGAASTGTITTYTWTRVSGPNTPTITTPSASTTSVTGLIQGVYVFQLSLNGGVSTDQVQITVNGTIVANAGPDQNITLPTSSITLDGTGSTGAVTSYLWTKVSGPNTPTIVSNTSSTTVVTGLIAGTYTFQLSVNGGVSTDQVVITVNPAIVANAGTNHSITLPTSTSNLDGSGSTGAITSYLWTKVSGPNTPTIVSPTTAQSSVTGLIQGTYTFQLSVNNGFSTSQVTITVNPAGVAGNCNCVLISKGTGFIFK